MKKLLLFLVLLSVTFTTNAQWTQTNGPGGGYIKSLCSNGTNLFAVTHFGGGVFLSTNNGSSWISRNNGLTNTDVLSIVASGTNLFVGTSGGGVFLSNNNGSSWTEVNIGLTSAFVYSLAVNGTNKIGRAHV